MIIHKRVLISCLTACTLILFGCGNTIEAQAIDTTGCSSLRESTQDEHIVADMLYSAKRPDWLVMVSNPTNREYRPGMNDLLISIPGAPDPFASIWMSEHERISAKLNVWAADLENWKPEIQRIAISVLNRVNQTPYEPGMGEVKKYYLDLSVAAEAIDVLTMAKALVTIKGREGDAGLAPYVEYIVVTEKKEAEKYKELLVEMKETKQDYSAEHDLSEKAFFVNTFGYNNELKKGEMAIKELVDHGLIVQD